MIETIKFTWPARYAVRAQRFKTAFQKHYGTLQTTNGQTVQHVRQALIAAGYDGHQVLVSWGTNLDQQLFASIMYDGSPSFLRKPRRRTPQEINVHTVCKHMRVRPHLSTALGELHPRICPLTTVTGYHQAHNDTAALCEVIAVMVSLIPADEVARMANILASGMYSY